jgi:hypothetical protein
MDTKEEDFVCIECYETIKINDGNFDAKLCKPCLEYIVNTSVPVKKCDVCKKDFDQENDKITLCKPCYDKKKS